MKICVSLFTLFLSFSAAASETGPSLKVLRKALSPTTEVGLFRQNGAQPRCPGCAAINVIVHQRIVPGATQIDYAVVTFRGQDTVLSEFHSGGTEPYVLPVSDKVFEVALPRGSSIPRAELTFYSRNCLNPNSPRCTRPRKAGTFVVYAHDLVNLDPVSEAEAVRGMLPHAAVMTSVE